jgi:hypothetical protein
MTKQAEMSSKKSAPTTYDERKAKALAAAEILKQVRKVRKQAQLLNLHMIVYLLEMAEMEACDFVANTPIENVLLVEKTQATEGPSLVRSMSDADVTSPLREVC